LPNNCQRKLKQDLAETDAAADSATRLEPKEAEGQEHYREERDSA
jgi:hypothetical protein